jgi:hypothetical protein
MQSLQNIGNCSPNCKASHYNKQTSSKGVSQILAQGETINKKKIAGIAELTISIPESNPTALPSLLVS